MSMARRYYYVTQSAPGWVVKTAGDERGVQFRTQADAITAAAQAARNDWEHGGTPSGVRIHDREGKWRDERTYGEDPFPPRG